MRKTAFAMALLLPLLSCIPEEPEGPYKGVCLTSWSTGELSSQPARDSLVQLQATNCDTVMVVGTWYMDTVSDNHVYEHTTKSATEADLRSILAEAKELGFKTALKPHVDPLDGGWRGQIVPDDADAWFASYTSYMMGMAQIAADLDCELFVVGTEFKSISGGAYQAYWVQLISTVRSVYPGVLTYSANWDEYPNVSFWEELDYLGVDAYFPLSDARDPSLAELTAAWSYYSGTYGTHRWLTDLENWSDPYGKKVIFTEVGYMSWDYAARSPWDYSSLPCDYNGELQARCYQAAIDATAGEAWLTGIFWWNWEPREVLDAEGQCSLPPQGKPAEEVLKIW